jgi:hypothetical protein
MIEIAERFFSLNEVKYNSDNVQVALDQIIDEFDLELLGVFYNGNRFQHGTQVVNPDVLLVFKTGCIFACKELYTCFESDVKLTEKTITTSKRRSIRKLYYNMLERCEYKLDQEKNRCFLYRREVNVTANIRKDLAYYQF